ncbi:putative flavin-containing monooxygenase FMO [Modestobacter italicus]|uniref:Flavin-containing monooxygenase FMO n=1 Tax=Modestobacter italicus (strain DSM 44449 / CECT 9708 / BC 501) TaxID=2732864 RepID=I4F4S5_MODI5|nr:NAD(P)/FAD-dependent oxidoreductase [Modestobacter marinus]CCH90638.1 putative flavin-containing monooxygenase FMO [Modestobacter marinus]
MTQTLDPADTRSTTPDDPAGRVTAWLEAFQSALTARDVDRAAELFAPTCFWRDLVAFSWNITTVEGQDGVRDLLRSTLDTTDPQGFRAAEPPTGADGVDEAWIEFETAVGRGKGHLRLQDGRAWTLLTTLYELTGHEEPARDRRPKGAEHGAQRDRQTWLDRREQEARELGYATQPYVLVIGGGQGGIALGARLRQLDIPTIVIDKHPRPGDQWRSRYKSLCLHDPVWYDHLPYIPFPENWPVFAPKDKIGDWLESYTRVMELNYWGNTRALSATYDEATAEWTVTVERDGKPVVLRPKQLVLATGVSGKPNVPVLPGQDVFRGDQHHSSAHPGPDAYRGKKCVVIGSNNSAFDICGALWENGADVTMVQRSSTHIVRSDSLMEVGLGALYSEEAVAGGMTTEKADLTFASLPYRIMHEFQIPLYDQMRERDADFYQRLEASGFDHDWGEDGSGLFMKYLRRGSGYYIDVGAADLVADGDVALVKGQVDHLTEDSVVLADGTELPADLVVYATGYGSMNGWAADLISQEVADRVGKVWGHGSGTTKDPGPWEGEQRNMWKPTQQEALWFHGGNLHQSRHYSLYLALQLKARQVGIPTPVYRLQEVHHTS